MIPSLDIIIVNRNSGHLLRECLTSIAATDRTGLTLSCIRVVDDCSTDNSLENIDNLGLPIELIHTTIRSGYGASCNVGAKDSKSDYLLFLNTDTILEQDSLIVPIKYMEQPENNRIGIVGIKLFDESGKVSRSCSRFPTVQMFLARLLGLSMVFPSIFPRDKMDEWDHLETREVDQVIGAFMLIRRPVFQLLSGYDESFFVYYEDLDLSLRTRKQGFKSIYLATTSARHIGGGSSRKVWPESLFFNMRSRILYTHKHFGLGAAFAIALATLLIYPLSRIVKDASTLNFPSVVATLQSSLLLWLNLPFILLNRPRCNWPG